MLLRETAVLPKETVGICLLFITEDIPFDDDEQNAPMIATAGPLAPVTWLLAHFCAAKLCSAASIAELTAVISVQSV